MRGNAWNSDVDKFGTRSALAAGNAYCFNAHADLLALLWAERDRLLHRSRLMDTTNVNPAVLKKAADD